MSKKRIALIITLVLLVVIVLGFFVFSITKKTTLAPTSNPLPHKAADRDADIKVEKSEPVSNVNVLEPLPIDNKDAIESEINNIEKEINSSIEVELDDLSDIENTF